MLFASLLATAALAVAQTSTCPFNYPAQLNQTASHHGLIFTITSNSPATNNRAIQLRPNPFLPGGFFVGVDNSSAVLLSNLQDGTVLSQARNDVNQLYNLGPTAYLNQRDNTTGTVRYTVGFATSTDFPGVPGPGQLDSAWYLSGGSEDGTSYLYHDEPLETVNGFLLCEADTDLGPGEWKQLFYETYTGTPADFPECENVGVVTTVAATIYNGECNIGGPSFY